MNIDNNSHWGSLFDPGKPSISPSAGPSLVKPIFGALSLLAVPTMGVLLSTYTITLMLSPHVALIAGIIVTTVGVILLLSSAVYYRSHYQKPRSNIPPAHAATPSMTSMTKADTVVPNVDFFSTMSFYTPTVPIMGSSRKNFIEAHEKKFFSHLHLDLSIGGTDLEGLPASEAMSFMKAELTKKIVVLQTKLKNFAAHEKAIAEIQKTISSLQQLLQSIERGQAVGFPYQLPSLMYVSKALNALSGLNIGESFMLFGGWIGEPLGHAIYYEVTKLPENKYRLKVYNSGAGIENHARRTHLIPGAQGRSPRLLNTYRPCLEITDIPAQNLEDESFLRTLHELGTLTKVDGNPTDYHAKDIYERLLPSLHGTIVEPSAKETEGVYIAPQHSGTCALSGLLAALQDHLHPIQYARFHFEMQRDSFQHFYQVCNVSGLKDDAEACAILRRGAEEFAAQAIIKRRQGVITLEEQIDCNRMSQDALALAIAAENQHEKELIESADKLKVCFETVQQNFFSDQVFSKATLLDGKSTVVPSIKTLWDPEWRPNPVTLDQQLKTFYETYSKAAVEEPMAVLGCLKELLFALPMPQKVDDPFWPAIPEGKVLACMDQIMHLSELLVITSVKVNFRKTPVFRNALIISLFKGYAIQHKLASRDKVLQSYQFDQWNTFPDLFWRYYVRDFGLLTTQTNVGNIGDSVLYDQEMHKQVWSFFQYQEPSYKSSFFDEAYIPSAHSSSYIHAREPYSLHELFREDSFAYQYCLDHGKAFDDSLLGKELSAAGFSSNSAKNLNEVRGTWAMMRDLTGIFFPPAFCKFKKQFILAGSFLQGSAFEAPHWRTNGSSFRTAITVWERMSSFPAHKERDTWEHEPFDGRADSMINKVFAFRPFPEREDMPLLKANSETLTQEELFILQNILVKNYVGHPIETFQLLSSLSISPRGIYQYLQLIRGLDYFSEQIAKLEDVDIQSFFRHLLCNDNDIIQLVRGNPELADRFLQFVQKGFSYFNERRNVFGATYFIYLGQLIESRLSTVSSEIPAVQQILEQYRKGRSAINQDPLRSLQNLLAISSTSLQKGVIHRQMLYIYSQMPPKEVQAYLPQIATSLAFIQSFSFPPEYRNRHLEYALERFRTCRLISLFRQNFAVPDRRMALIHAITIGVGNKEKLDKEIDWTRVEWRNRPPFYVAVIDGTEVCTINIEECTILKARGRQVHLPMTIMQHSHFAKNFSEAEYLCQMINEGLYEFTDQRGCLIRFAQMEGGQIKIQRQFVRGGSFYEYVPPELLRTKVASNVLMSLKHMLFNERNHWISCTNDNDIVFCKTGTAEITHLLETSGAGWNVVDVTTRCHLLRLKEDKWPYSIFGRIEDSQHINIWGTPSGIVGQYNVSRIDLPKMGLRFVVEGDPPRARCLEHTGFFISEVQLERAFGNFQNYLVLENAQGVKRIIVPRKPIASGSRKLIELISLQVTGNTSRLPPYYTFFVNSRGNYVASHEGGNLFLGYLLFGQRRFKESQEYFRIRARKPKRYTARESEIFSWLTERHRETSADPRATAVFLTAHALLIKNRNLYRNRITEMERKSEEELSQRLYEEYRNYSSLTEYMGDLLLAPEEEATILKEILKYIPTDSFIRERLRVVQEPLSIPFTEVDDAAIKGSIEQCFNRLNPVEDANFNSSWISSLTNCMTQSSQSSIKATAHTMTRPKLDLLKIQTAYEDVMQNAYTGIRGWQKAHAFEIRRNFCTNQNERIIYRFLQIVALNADRFPSWQRLAQIIGNNDKSLKDEATKLVNLTTELYNTQYRMSQPKKDKDKHSQEVSSKVELASVFKQQKMKGAAAAVQSVDPAAMARKLQQDIKENSAGLAAREEKRLKDECEAFLKQSAVSPVRVAPSEAVSKVNEKEIEELQQRILILANKKEAAEKTRKAQEVSVGHTSDILATYNRELTIGDLCLCLLNADSIVFKQRNPNLSDADIAQLRTMMTQYLVTVTDRQRALRIECAEKELELYRNKLAAEAKSKAAEATDTTLKDLVEKVQLARNARREFDAASHPELLIFEFYTNLSLKREQVAALESFHRNPFLIKKLIMGAGKSKVLLPILALLLALEDRLSVIVLPEAMLETTAKDLRHTVGESFSRAIHILSFNRSTDFTIDKLQHLYDELRLIRQKRECVIMTSQTIKSLLLKFEEACLNFTEGNEELCTKITLLQNILKLFKTGKLIIEEADQNLDCQIGELNFPLGRSISLHSSRYEIVSKLYQELCTNEEIRKLTNNNPILNYSRIASIWHEASKPQKSIKAILLDSLLEKLNLPASFRKDAAAIRSFLLNRPGPEATQGEKILKDLYLNGGLAQLELIQQLFVLKEQLNKLLPFTLSKRCYVDYGPSQRKNVRGPFCRLAKPYRANNTPDERSDYGNPYVRMNFTIQMDYLLGITSLEISAIVGKLQARSLSEQMTEPNMKDHQTAASREFAALCKGDKELQDLTLAGCKVADFLKIAESINRHRTTDPERFHKFLQDYILPEIKIQPEKITCNTFDCVGVYESAVGFTGTTQISDSFPEPLRANTDPTLGTDGKSILLLQQKLSHPGRISLLENTSWDTIVEQLIKTGPDAIIDTGAVFQGLQNEAVARLLLNKLPGKQGVVFFQGNVAKVLMRIEEEEPRIIDFSECQLSPEQRYTYYDHSHTTGADILQAVNAQASLTVGPNMTTRDLFQGAWRMRGLDKFQNISLIVTSDAAVLLPSGLTYDSVFRFVQKNQVKKQMEHILLSTRLKIEQVVKQFLIQKLIHLDLTRPEVRKAFPEMMKKLRRILVTEMDDNPFNTYASRERLLNRDEVIKTWKDKVLKQAQSLLNHPLLFGMETDEQNAKEAKAFWQNVEKQIDDAIRVIIPLFPEQISSSEVGQMDRDAKVQVEQVKEEQRRLEAVRQPLTNSNYYRRKFWYFWKLFVSGSYSSSLIEKAISDISARFFNVSDVLARSETTRRFAKLGGDLLMSSNRMDLNKDFSSGTQIPMQYVLFVRHKKKNRLDMILLDSICDVPYVWEQLSKDRKEAVSKTDREVREVEICLCNINGEVVQHDRTINMANDSHPFVQAMRTQGVALRTRAKLLLGIATYTKEEMPHVQALIKTHGPKLISEHFQYLCAQNPADLSKYRQGNLYPLLQPLNRSLA